MAIVSVTITPAGTQDLRRDDRRDEADFHLELCYPDRPDIPSNIILGEN